MRSGVSTEFNSGRLLLAHRSTKEVDVAARGEKVQSLVGFSFLFFVFTLPFEAADIGISSGRLSLPRICGLLFFALYFFYYNPLTPKRSLARSTPALWCFLAYVTIYTVRGLSISDEFATAFFTRFMTLVQLLGFFWVSSELLKDEDLSRRVLLVYAFAAAILAAGFTLHLPGFSVEIAERSGRATALDYNPNNMATIMAVALVMLIGLSFQPKFKSNFNRVILLALALPLLVGVVSTGSRAGVGALVAGFVVFLLPYRRSKHKLASAILATLGLIAITYMVIRNDAALARWQLVMEGNLANRQELVPIAIDMFFEQPIFGWKPFEFWYELGTRTGKLWGQTDAHNLFLHLLVEVGLVGALPFVIGLWCCAREAWAARHQSMGILPLALLVTMVAAAMTHTYLTRKPLWLALAFTQAGAVTGLRQKKKPGVLLAPRLRTITR
jgi:O-antigen ligase